MIWFDRRLDPANVQSTPGRRSRERRGELRQRQDQHAATGIPTCGFFTSGAFIGDYNGLAASTDAVYAVWTDGRNNAIGQTGIGETDIFTNFQKNP